MEIIKADWGIQNLQIADFDGDGKKDIGFVNNSKAEIDLLIQKPQIGPGEPEVAVTAEDSDINAIVSRDAIYEAGCAGIAENFQFRVRGFERRRDDGFGFLRGTEGALRNSAKGR